MGKLTYNITGLQEFIVSFEEYCVTCPDQKRCKSGKAEPFQITIDCKEITAALDHKKSEAMDKLGKKHPDWDWDMKEKKAKVSKPQIYSKLWNDKVKALKEEILCLDSRRTDSMITSQRGEEWWSDFRETMSSIDDQCSKIC
jgi:hypothetical protein